MQPTTLCNLDCAYCYLPFRAVDRRMPVAVARGGRRVGRTAGRATGRFSVVWHGGEPLAAGRDHLAALLAPFDAGVEHHVQTNATLIDDAWCEFFAEHEVRVSVSVDGPRGAQRRPGRPGAASPPTTGSCAASRRCAGTASRSPRSAWSATRGRAWPPSCTTTSSTSAATCSASTSRSWRASTPATTRTRRRTCRRSGPSWSAAWRRDPRIHLREIEWSLRYAGGGARRHGRRRAAAAARPDPDGRARRLGGAALAGAGRLHRPAVRRLHQRQRADHPAGRDPGRAARRRRWIARVPRRASRRAAATCPYFGFCGGAHAANRYFEHGRFDGTETDHCRNSKIRLLEGVLDHARDHEPTAV